MAESKPHELREYQVELLEAAKERNIIVCLGTGTGKTFISIKLIEHLARVNDIIRAFSQGGKRTFFLVNSVPLVFQQAEAIKKYTALNVKPFCGEMGVDFWSKEDWLKEFEDNHVLVMTHQIYLDLLQHAKLKLSQANLLVFDECHHAHKNHPFKKIMDCFADNHERDHPRILGLTASVVSTKVKPHQIGDEIKKLEHTLRSVCKTASDPNVVEKYGAKPKEMMLPYSSSNNLDEIAKYLECEFHYVMDPLQAFLQDMKVVRQASGSEETILKELDVAKSAVRECLSALDDIGIWAAYEVSIMLVDDLEKRSKKVSNGIASLILQTTVTSLRELDLKYNEFRIANLKGQERIQQEYLKPKVKQLLKLFASKAEDNSKLCSIVFVERRYAACVVSKLMNTLASEGWPEYSHLNSDFVTGHGSDLWGISETEMNFNTQKEKLMKFRRGDFNVLVGTSVVEEGVDIPKCNLVVMFDFPNNYRAFVQSRGRGRAKDAQYVLLVKKDELARRRQEQEMYQHVDRYLTELCQRNRDEPTDEEALEAVNVYPLENYFTEKNAKLDMGNSIPLLYRYCSKLPCDRFTNLKPKFTFNDVGNDEFQCSLKMPGNSHVTGIIKGDPMPSKQEAKQAVAYIVCKMLHEYEALDEHLLPATSSSESETEEDEIDGPSQHKTGTRKRQREHTVKTSKQVYGGLTTDGSKKVYVYVINMKFDEVYNEVKKTKLWDKREISLGIITNVKLPEQLPSFSLYNDIGKLTVVLERRRSITALTSKQRELVDWFHRFIFTETLEFKLGLLTGNGCRVVLLDGDDNHRMTTRSLSGSTARINFHEMELLKKKVLESDGRVSLETDLVDSVVTQNYRNNSGHYMVTSITADNCYSRFPNQDKAGTFKEYFEKTYEYKIRDLSQLLVQVVNHSRRIDCRRSKITTKKSRPMQIPPEMLYFRKSPQSLTLRALFLPAILYRVDSLVSISELRDHIDLASNLSCYTNPREFQLKKLKSSFDFEDLDLSGEEQGVSSQATMKKPSSLSQYFYAFDSLKSVPLFKLLEALTCASSGDDFNLERLEMLGDSFLKMAVSVHVYWHKDHKDEGKLTKYRTRQISNKNLFKLAQERNLSGYIKYSAFSKETWVPPGFLAQNKIQNGDLSFSSDEEDDDVIDGHDVIKQLISDKSIADSMEALIGAHFIHCGYMGALGFMTWLGVDVLHSDEDEEPTNEGRRKSPTPQHPSAYANYPLPTLDPPTNEDSARYEDILKRETKEMASFEKKIGYKFKNKVLLLEAFTHPTYNENTITGSYQRLEFLGDAILDFLVTQHIYNNSKKDLTPGDLTDLRSALVNNNIFAVIAVNNDYDKYLKEYSPTLFTTIGHFVEGVQQYQELLGDKVIPDPYVIAVQSDSSDVECIEAPKPLGDVFESVAGAIFLDSGLNLHEVWRVCHPLLKKYIDEYSKNVPKNPIRTVKELDGDSKFSSANNLDDGRISCVLTYKARPYEGVGRNKHNAKLSAAYKALKQTNYRK